MKNVIISSCLLGENVRYNAEPVEISEGVRKLSENYTLIPVCPEILGGLDVPREPCEIQWGEGSDVISGSAKVIGNRGTDCTGQFVKGAQMTLEKAKEHSIEFAVLKQRSPSCGCGVIYTGEFCGKTKPGRGVTAALLEISGIRVISEENL